MTASHGAATRPIDTEAALDGIYIIGASVPAASLDGPAAVTALPPPSAAPSTSSRPPSR